MPTSHRRKGDSTDGAAPRTVCILGAGPIRIGQAAEFGARHHEACLDPKHVQRLATHGFHPIRLACGNQPVPDFQRVVFIAEKLIPKLAREPRTTQHEHWTVAVVEPRSR